MKTEDSIILKNQEVGSRITEDLSTYLMRWTTMSDRGDAAEIAQISGETMSAIVKRRRNVTENTYPALVALVNIAIKNCSTASEEAGKAQKFMKKLTA